MLRWGEIGGPGNSQASRGGKKWQLLEKKQGETLCGGSGFEPGLRVEGVCGCWPVHRWEQTPV